jgi:hypothetical protein
MGVKNEDTKWIILRWISTGFYTNLLIISIKSSTLLARLKAKKAAYCLSDMSAHTSSSGLYLNGRSASSDPSPLEDEDKCF